jgi:hypothetical protein
MVMDPHGYVTPMVMYQLYSFAGMLPAGIYTNAAMLAPYPIYQYDELRKRD